MKKKTVVLLLSGCILTTPMLFSANADEHERREVNDPQQNHAQNDSEKSLIEDKKDEKKENQGPCDSETGNDESFLLSKILSWLKS